MIEMLKGRNAHMINIGGRLPENSRNSFNDLQSQRNIKKDQKIALS